jgi:MFS family permease
MRRKRRIIPILLLLPILAAATYFGMMQFQDSFEQFQSPLKETLPDAAPSSPIVQQVVLVIVDGLRYDTSLHLPFLNSLRDRGVTAVMHSTPPSFSQPSWTTLVTGATPDTNGSPPLNAEYADIKPIPVDHIFASLRRAGMTSAIAGFNWWEKMVPQDLLQASYYTEGEDEDADRAVFDNSLDILNAVHPNFLLVHFDQVDYTGHAYGGESPQYLAAALSADHMIELIADTLDFQDTVLVVVSDHGHIARGGHGGQDAIILREPFVMAGKGVVPGDLGDVNQADVAPTIAALLGAAPPSASQGHALLDALDMSVEQRTEILVSMAHQRIALGNLYLASIGAGELSDVAPGDADVAQSSIEVQNYDSAAKLASYAIDQVDSEMQVATEKILIAERNYRRIFAVIAVILPLYIVYRKRSVRTFFLGLAAVASVAAYNVYFVRTGNVYSLSTITGLEPFLMQVAIGVGVGLVVGLVIVVARLWAERERDWVNITLSTYGFVYFILYFLAIQVAIGYVQNGFTTGWHLPDFFTAFLQFTGMVQGIVVAAVGVMLPLPTLLLNGAMPRAIWKIGPHVRGLVRRVKFRRG